jgi:hypothetical protein
MPQEDDYLKQLDEMIEVLESLIKDDVTNRAETLAFRRKFSKRERLDRLETDLALIRPLVFAMMMPKLIEQRDKLRQATSLSPEDRKELVETLQLFMRLTTFKKGEG